MKKLILSSFTTASLFALLNTTAQACNGCMGKPDDTLAPALAGAIFVLVAALGVVAAVFFKFVLFLAKRDGLPIPADAAQG